MKKLKPFISTAGAIMLAITLLAGCTRADTPETTPTPNSPSSEVTPSAPEPAPEPETPAEPTAEASLEDIVGQISNIESVTFDMIVSNQEVDEVTTRVWLKGQHSKMQTDANGQVVINIVNEETQTIYMYMPDQNTAFRLAYDESLESPLEKTQEALTQYQPQTIGTETIDGKVCLVVEYEVSGTSTTVWLWQEYGFPIHAVTVNDQGTTTIDYRNIDFSPIPDSEFELPPGVQIIDYPSQ